MPHGSPVGTAAIALDPEKLHGHQMRVPTVAYYNFMRIVWPMSESILDFQLEQAFGFNVNRTAFLMTEEIARRFSAAGYPLVAQDFGILYRLEQQGSMTQVEIAAMLMRDKTTVTRRIDGLVRKGVLARSSDPNDRRYFRIALTDEGKRALKAMKPLVRDFQLEVLSDIPEAEQAVAIRVLKSVSEKLSQSKDQE